MALKFGDPPLDSVNQLADALPRFADQMGGAAPARMESVRRSAESDRRAALFPHQVFALTLEDVRAGKGLEAARPTAWRYLIGADSALPQAADVRSGPDGRNALEALRGGSTPVVTLRAVQQLQGDPRFEDGSYEIRLLLFPAARLRALWLAAEAAPDHERDLFYLLNDPSRPMQPPPDALVNYQRMRAWLMQLANAVDTRDPE